MDKYGLKNFKRMHPVITVTVATAVAVLVCWTSFMFVRTYQAVYANKNSDYNFIGADSGLKEKNSYYLLKNINVKKSVDSNILYPDVFMQGEGVEYFGNFLDGFNEKSENFKKDECAISEGFANDTGLKKGSKFVIHIKGGYDYTVTVKKILPEYFGFDDVDIYKNKGAVVLGFNEDAITNESDYTIYSFTVESKLFGGQEGLVYSKNNILKGLNKYYYTATGITCLTVLLALVTLDLLFGVDGILGKKERHDVAIFYAETANRLQKLIYTFVYSAYKYLATFAVSAVLSLFGLFFGYKVVLFALVYNCLLWIVCTVFSTIINYFTAGISYGK